MSEQVAVPLARLGGAPLTEMNYRCWRSWTPTDWVRPRPSSGTGTVTGSVTRMWRGPATTSTAGCGRPCSPVGSCWWSVRRRAARPGPRSKPHDSWPQARLLAPTPIGLNRLVAHPRLASTADPVVVWLDDLQRFLSGTDPLTPAMLTRLLSRSGSTVVLATLRQEERDRLRAASGELTRDTRRLLDDARDTTFELGPTSDGSGEQAAARAAYPTADLSTTGLGEQLAGRASVAVPVLRRQVLRPIAACGDANSDRLGPGGNARPDSRHRPSHAGHRGTAE